MLTDLRYRLRALFRKRLVERELEDELRLHLEHETWAHIAKGIAPEEAARRARLALGGVAQVKEICREAHGVSLVETAARDLKFAVRMLLKAPGFTVIAILTLALGIGGNTAIFSAVKGILLRPLPYQDASRLVMIWEENPHRGWTHNIVSAANFQDWRRRNHVFSDMAAFVTPTYTLTGEGEPVEISGEQVTPNLLPLLGISPLYGRGFTEEEGAPGGHRTVLLGYGFWQAKFGGEMAAVGRQIAINLQSYTIIGVLPPGFDGCEACMNAHRPQIWTSGLDTRPTGRTNHSFRVVARLRPGISIAQAQAEMTGIADQISQEDPNNKGWTATVLGIRDDSVRVVAPAIMVLLGAVVLVLLIACVNLANVLLARGASRQREIAIRTVMGAGRRRVIAQLLTENALLALIGGGLGAAIAAFATRLLRYVAPAAITPGLENVGMNGPVLAYGAGLVVVTVLLFGLAPAILTARHDLNDTLKQSGRGTASGAGHGLRGLLVATEFALAVVLVVGAALMIVSVAKIRAVPMGFDSDNVLTMRIPLRGGVYRSPARVAALLQELVARVETLPGVEKASISRGVPVEGWNGLNFVTEENPYPAPGEEPDANYLVVSPRYFNLMHIPLHEGRAFSESDGQTAPRVAIVSQELVRKWWSGANPIGKRISMGVHVDNRTWLTVVGVAGDVMTQGPGSNVHPEIYVPLAQYPWAIIPRHLLIRTAPGANMAAIVSGIRKLLASLDPMQPVSDVVPLEAIVRQPLAVHRFLTWLLVAFAALALLLAGLGVYGVLSYSVSQRTQEIGIRMALGAERGELRRQVISRGLTLAFAGIVAGVGGALALTGYLRSLLYEIGPRDPVTFALVPAILLAIALAASYVPARRATAVDPMIALRYE